MHIILGGTGHVGSAAAMSLLQQGEAVTIVTREPSKGADWTRRGAEPGERLFLLNPPADPSTDTDVEEPKTVAAITAALEGSGLRKIVAQSTSAPNPATGAAT